MEKSAYMRLVDSIADTMYDTNRSGMPVYALADEDTVSRVLHDADIPGSSLEDFALAIRPTLNIDQPRVRPFSWQAEMAAKGLRKPLDAPVALPLLVLLSAVAEQMQAGDNIAAHNYYSRLHELLRVSDDNRQRVEQGYRTHAEVIWKALNTWLEAWEGERGMPTAYAVGGHSYIGLPMSQAVVRQHDRNGLQEIYQLEGLVPGVGISPSDMASCLERYVNTENSPLSSHLRSIWRTPSARERLVDAAGLELLAWDGVGLSRTATNEQKAPARLVAYLTTFLRKSINFNLLLPSRDESITTVSVEVENNQISLPVTASTGGTIQFSGTEGIDNQSLLADHIRGYFGISEGSSFERKPRRVVPLRQDNLHGGYVESERVDIGQNNLVLVRQEMSSQVEQYLGEHARPGWVTLTGYSGIPSGWCAYNNVQILTGPDAVGHLDLMPLMPRSKVSLTLRGGLILPGHLRKWSSLSPPEIVVVQDGASEVNIKIYEGSDLRPEQIVLEAGSHEGALVYPITPGKLKDGEYLIVAFADGNDKPVATSLLRLRSAATPQFQVDDVDLRLVYSPGSKSGWPLSADLPNWTRYINGARYIGDFDAGKNSFIAVPDYIPRPRRNVSQLRSTVRIGQVASPDSCAVTGRHRIQLPPLLRGERRARNVEGECAGCGLVRRYAGTPYAAKRKTTPIIELSDRAELPSIVEFGDNKIPELLFDAINHVGHGTMRQFERISAQLDSSPHYSDMLLRMTEVLGHVDVKRDENHKVAEWAVNAATLMPVARNKWVLIGARSQALVEAIRTTTGTKAIVRNQVDVALPRLEIEGEPNFGALEQIGVTILEESPAFQIASALPPISSVVASLKRIAIPGYQTIDHWDTKYAQWQPCDTLTKVGAYRISNYGTIYGVRSEEDIANETVGLGSAQIVKHIANFWANDPLLTYHDASKSAIVPLGADLPGLYGRALALSSGLVPRSRAQNRILQYREVPRYLTALVYERLGT